MWPGHVPLDPHQRAPLWHWGSETPTSPTRPFPPQEHGKVMRPVLNIAVSQSTYVRALMLHEGCCGTDLGYYATIEGGVVGPRIAGWAIQRLSSHSHIIATCWHHLYPCSVAVPKAKALLVLKALPGCRRCRFRAISLWRCPTCNIHRA